MQSLEKKSGYLDNLKHTLRALRGRNYMLFFFGQSVSNTGTWIQQTALMLLVYKVTHNPFYLGLVGFTSMIFSLPIAPFAGVYSDRVNRRKLLVFTQLLMSIQALLLTVLTFSGHIEVWHILTLASLLGLISSIDIPTRQAFVSQLVTHHSDLPNAIALNSFVFNSARLIGPVIAGVFIIPIFDKLIDIPYAGEGACFALNAISYTAVICSLLAMRLEPFKKLQSYNHPLKDLKVGLSYSFGFPPIRTFLIMLGMISFLMMPYVTLLPAITAKVLHHSQIIPRGLDFEQAAIAPIILNLGFYKLTLAYENTYGMLIAAQGVGAILGAIFLASRRSIVGLGRIMGLASLGLGVGMVGFSMSEHVMFSALLIAIINCGFMIQNASSNTIIQTIVEDDKRGRVMSFYTMAFQGTAPFGALLAGYLANKLGAHGEQYAIMLAGLMASLTAVAFLIYMPRMRKYIRPIYVKMGIISDTAPIPKEAVKEDIEAVK